MNLLFNNDWAFKIIAFKPTISVINSLGIFFDKWLLLTRF